MPTLTAAFWQEPFLFKKDKQIYKSNTNLKTQITSIDPGKLLSSPKNTFVEFSSSPISEPCFHYQKFKISPISAKMSLKYANLNTSSLTDDEIQSISSLLDIHVDKLPDVSYVFFDKDGFSFPAFQNKELYSELLTHAEEIPRVMWQNDLYDLVKNKQKITVLCRSRSDKKVRQMLRRARSQINAILPYTFNFVEFEKANQLSKIDPKSDKLTLIVSQDCSFADNIVNSVAWAKDLDSKAIELDCENEDVIVNKLFRLVKPYKGNLNFLEEPNLAEFLKVEAFYEKAKIVLFLNETDNLAACRSLFEPLKEISDGLQTNSYLFYTCSKEIGNFFNVYKRAEENISVRFIDYGELVDASNLQGFKIKNEKELSEKLSKVPNKDLIFTKKSIFSSEVLNRDTFKKWLETMESGESEQYFEQVDYFDEAGVIKSVNSAQLASLFADKGRKVIVAIGPRGVGSATVLNRLKNNEKKYKGSNIYVYDKNNEHWLIPKSDSDGSIYLVSSKVDERINLEEVMQKQDWWREVSKKIDEYV